MAKPLDSEKLRLAIIGGLNLLSAADNGTILGRMPAGGPAAERMCERLRDHLREAIGLKTYPDSTGVDDAEELESGNAAADRWLKVTGYVRDKWPSKKKRRVISSRPKAKR
jgi:hypothetical protein